MRVRVVLEVGTVEDDVETITGEIASAESFWAGSDLTNAAAVELYDKIAALVVASNPV